MNLNNNDLEKYLSAKLRLSQGTIVNRKSRIRIFAAWFLGEIPIPTDIEDFFYHLKQKGLSNTTLNTYIVSLRTLQKYLIDRNGVEPFMKGFGLYKEEDPEINPLTVEEAILVKKNCIDAENELIRTRKDITLFLIDTGARWEDAQNLKVKYINLTGREVIYNQLKTKRRRVHAIVDEYLLERLENRIKHRSPEQLVFVNTAGGHAHYPDYYEWLSSFCKSLGITKRVSPHILRHTYIQNLYDKTKDILLTSNVAGHALIETTMRYARNATETIKKAQEIHPHVQDNVRPEVTIEMIEKTLKSFGLRNDKRFNATKIIRAKMQFIQNLYGAII